MNSAWLATSHQDVLGHLEYTRFQLVARAEDRVNEFTQFFQAPKAMFLSQHQGKSLLLLTKVSNTAAASAIRKIALP